MAANDSAYDLEFEVYSSTQFIRTVDHSPFQSEDLFWHFEESKGRPSVMHQPSRTTMAANDSALGLYSSTHFLRTVDHSPLTNEEILWSFEDSESHAESDVFGFAFLRNVDHTPSTRDVVSCTQNGLDAHGYFGDDSKIGSEVLDIDFARNVDHSPSERAFIACAQDDEASSDIIDRLVCLKEGGSLLKSCRQIMQISDSERKALNLMPAPAAQDGDSLLSRCRQIIQESDSERKRLNLMPALSAEEAASLLMTSPTRHSENCFTHCSRVISSKREYSDESCSTSARSPSPGSELGDLSS